MQPMLEPGYNRWKIQGCSRALCKMSRGIDILKKKLFPFLVFSSVVLLDYITKKLIEIYVKPHEVITVFPFLRIVNVKNTGAAFGLFANLGNNIFIIISLIAIILIILYLLRTDDELETLSLSLILGGAMGNLIDRITISQVIDFIDFFIGKRHWPAFNVADSALTIGLFLLLLANIRHWRRH